MRVLEAEPSILYKMGKNKKHRIRKAKENDVDESSDDGVLSGCPHITKAVNINNIRKYLTKPSVSVDECADCAREGTKTVTRDLFGGVVEGLAPAVEEDEAEGVSEVTICVCLQCGHQGCDRNSPNKHALKHFKTPHSGLHCIIVNLTNWSTWCYQCDDVVPVNARMQGSIDFLQKLCGVRPSRLESVISSTVKATETMLSEASSLSSNMLAAKSPHPVSCTKVKGLNNLGNTCFFNAVMQSLCQTRGLESLLMERSKQEKVIIAPPSCYDSESSSSEDERDEDSGEKPKPLPPIQTSGGEPGPVTQALLGFMQEMKGGSSRNGTVNPTPLFTQVCKKAPRFKGFQQQDSHELLRYLIDSIRTEEIKKGQCSILKFFRLSETVNPKKVDDETKMKIKQYGREVKHTFFDSIFGGQLVSTVKCEECKNVSQIYEAFLDLSLPVMEEKPQRPSVTLIGKKKDFISMAEDGDVAASVASNMGLDSCVDRPSKYQDKKSKRNARKDAKKKGKAPKGKTYNLSQFMNQEDAVDKGSGDQENASEDSCSKAVEENECGELENGDEMAACSKDAGADSVKNSEDTPLEEPGACALASSLEGSKERLDVNRDGSSSSKDDPSDADIEDNLEGDNARCAMSFSDTQRSVEVSNEVTLTLPGFTGQDLNSESLNHKAVADATNVDGLVDKVESIHIQEVNNGEKQLTTAKCDIFTVDTFVNNCSGNQVVGEGCNGGLAQIEHKSDSDKENVSMSSQNPAVSSDKDSLTKSSEVSAVFTVSLPTSPTSTPTPQEEKESVVSLSSTNDVIAVVKDLTKEKKENSECDHQEDRKAAGLPGNGTKSKQEYIKEAKQLSMNTLAPRYQPAPKECSIWSCLNQFTAAELLTGSNKVGCKSCTKNKSKNAAAQKEKKGKETVYSNANKQYLIFRPPAVLTLHLKRFEQTGLTSRKVNRHVDFPLTLDLAPYCSSLSTGVKEGQSKVLYSLYGIVEHSGRLNGGHYTAYVKLRPGVTSATQFLNTSPPTSLDMLNAYLDRVLKSKFQPNGEATGPKCSNGGAEVIDKEMEAAAETLSSPGRWFHISDSRVNEVSEASVLKAQAYLLFYERIF